jgi:hypothetical protein
LKLEQVVDGVFGKLAADFMDKVVALTKTVIVKPKKEWESGCG